jgi:hypothetical protein
MDGPPGNLMSHQSSTEKDIVKKVFSQKITKLPGDMVPITKHDTSNKGMLANNVHAHA